MAKSLDHSPVALATAKTSQQTTAAPSTYSEISFIATQEDQPQTIYLTSAGTQHIPDLEQPGSLESTQQTELTEIVIHERPVVLTKPAQQTATDVTETQESKVAAVVESQRKLSLTPSATTDLPVAREAPHETVHESSTLFSLPTSGPSISELRTLERPQPEHESVTVSESTVSISTGQMALEETVEVHQFLSEGKTVVEQPFTPVSVTENPQQTPMERELPQEELRESTTQTAMHQVETTIAQPEMAVYEISQAPEQERLIVSETVVTELRPEFPELEGHHAEWIAPEQPMFQERIILTGTSTVVEERHIEMPFPAPTFVTFETAPLVSTEVEEQEDAIREERTVTEPSTALIDYVDETVTTVTAVPETAEYDIYLPLEQAPSGTVQNYSATLVRQTEDCLLQPMQPEFATIEMAPTAEAEQTEMTSTVVPFDERQPVFEETIAVFAPVDHGTQQEDLSTVELITERVVVERFVNTEVSRPEFMEFEVVPNQQKPIMSSHTVEMRPEFAELEFAVQPAETPLVVEETMNVYMEESEKPADREEIIVQPWSLSQQDTALFTQTTIVRRKESIDRPLMSEYATFEIAPLEEVTKPKFVSTIDLEVQKEPHGYDTFSQTIVTEEWTEQEQPKQREATAVERFVVERVMPEKAELTPEFAEFVYLQRPQPEVQELPAQKTDAEVFTETPTVVTNLQEMAYSPTPEFATLDFAAPIEAMPTESVTNMVEVIDVRPTYELFSKTVITEEIGPAVPEQPTEQPTELYVVERVLTTEIDRQSKITPENDKPKIVHTELPEEITPEFADYDVYLQRSQAITAEASTTETVLFRQLARSDERQQPLSEKISDAVIFTETTVVQKEPLGLETRAPEFATLEFAPDTGAAQTEYVTTTVKVHDQRPNFETFSRTTVATEDIVESEQQPQPSSEQPMEHFVVERVLATEISPQPQMAELEMAPEVGKSVVFESTQPKELKPEFAEFDVALERPQTTVTEAISTLVQETRALVLETAESRIGLSNDDSYASYIVTSRRPRESPVPEFATLEMAPVETVTTIETTVQPTLQETLIETIVVEETTVRDTREQPVEETPEMTGIGAASTVENREIKEEVPQPEFADYDVYFEKPSGTIQVNSQETVVFESKQPEKPEQPKEESTVFLETTVIRRKQTSPLPEFATFEFAPLAEAAPTQYTFATVDDQDERPTYETFRRTVVTEEMAETQQPEQPTEQPTENYVMERTFTSEMSRQQPGQVELFHLELPGEVQPEFAAYDVAPEHTPRFVTRETSSTIDQETLLLETAECRISLSNEDMETSVETTIMRKPSEPLIPEFATVEVASAVIPKQPAEDTVKETIITQIIAITREQPIAQPEMAELDFAQPPQPKVKEVGLQPEFAELDFSKAPLPETTSTVFEETITIELTDSEKPIRRQPQGDFSVYTESTIMRRPSATIAPEFAVLEFAPLVEPEEMPSESTITIMDMNVDSQSTYETLEETGIMEQRQSPVVQKEQVVEHPAMERFLTPVESVKQPEMEVIEVAPMREKPLESRTTTELQLEFAEFDYLEQPESVPERTESIEGQETMVFASVQSLQPVVQQTQQTTSFFIESTIARRKSETQTPEFAILEFGEATQPAEETMGTESLEETPLAAPLTEKPWQPEIVELDMALNPEKPEEVEYPEAVAELKPEFAEYELAPEHVETVVTADVTVEQPLQPVTQQDTSVTTEVKVTRGGQSKVDELSKPEVEKYDVYLPVNDFPSQTDFSEYSSIIIVREEKSVEQPMVPEFATLEEALIDLTIEKSGKAAVQEEVVVEEVPLQPETTEYDILLPLEYPQQPKQESFLSTEVTITRPEKPIEALEFVELQIAPSAPAESGESVPVTSHPRAETTVVRQEVAFQPSEVAEYDVFLPLDQPLPQREFAELQEAPQMQPAVQPVPAVFELAPALPRDVVEAPAMITETNAIEVVEHRDEAVPLYEETLLTAYVREYDLSLPITQSQQTSSVYVETAVVGDGKPASCASATVEFPPLPELETVVASETVEFTATGRFDRPLPTEEAVEQSLVPEFATFELTPVKAVERKPEETTESEFLTITQQVTTVVLDEVAPGEEVSIETVETITHKEELQPTPILVPEFASVEIAPLSTPETNPVETESTVVAGVELFRPTQAQPLVSEFAEVNVPSSTQAAFPEETTLVASVTKYQPEQPGMQTTTQIEYSATATEQDSFQVERSTLSVSSLPVVPSKAIEEVEKVQKEFPELQYQPAEVLELANYEIGPVERASETPVVTVLHEVMSPTSSIAAPQLTPVYSTSLIRSMQPDSTSFVEVTQDAESVNLQVRIDSSKRTLLIYNYSTYFKTFLFFFIF